MIVAELAVILDHVPPDLPVIVQGARGAVHVGHVWRHTHINLAYGNGLPRRDRPAGLVLEGPWWHEGSLGRWFEPEPDFTLHGPFRRGAELEHRLDGVR